MNYSQPKKEFLFAAGFVILNLAILFSGAWFLTNMIIANSQDYQRKQADLKVAQEEWQLASQQQKEFKKIETELEKINQSFLPPNKPTESIGLIKLLENLAQKTGNSFEINLIPAPPGATANDLFFHISLTGTFQNFMHFLRSVENMKYYAEVKLVQINRAGGQALPAAPGSPEIVVANVSSVINLRILVK